MSLLLQNKLVKNIAVALLCTLLIGGAVGIAFYYIFGPGEGYFHSDCSDSIYWANAALEGNGIFDETFRYAALLPFSSQIWMAPLIMIFGVGMTAHNISMAIFALLFVGAMFFFLRSAKLSYTATSASIFVTNLLLSSSDKLREIMWGHVIYYSLGLLLLFTVGGLVLRLCESKRISALITFSLLLAIMSAGVATDGFQVIAISTLPILGGIFLETLFDGRHKLISKHSILPVLACGVIAVCTLVGMVILASLTENITASYADTYSNYTDIGTWADNLMLFPKQYFSLIGVTGKRGEPLFDKASISNIVRIAAGLAILIIPLFMAIFYKKLKSRGVRVALIAHFILSAAIMFGFVCGLLSGANWRLTPIVGSAALVSSMGIAELLGLVKKEETDETSEAQAEASDAIDTSDDADNAPDKAPALTEGMIVCRRIGALCLALLMLSSLITFNDIKKMPSDYGRDNALHQLVEYCEAEGLEYGYATFWRSQAVTMLSDSRVKCREIIVGANNGITTDRYQSSSRWYRMGDAYDKYFVILSSTEYQNFAKSSQYQMFEEGQSIVKTDKVAGYYVIIFNCDLELEITQ